MRRSFVDSEATVARSLRNVTDAERGAAGSVFAEGADAGEGIRILDRASVASLLGPEEYAAVVEEVFLAHARGEALSPGATHTDAPGGEFHVKTGGFLRPEPRFAVKANGGFFGNAEREGLPNIQGAILLFDAGNGRPLALLDSIEITIRRTGAATAVAARVLAREDASVATVLGCGTQGRAQLEALAAVLPLERVYAWSRSPERAESFAEAARGELGLEVEPVREPAQAVRASLVCVTCTPAREPILAAEWVRPGAFVAAVGADSPEKHEVETALLARARVVVDLLSQCASVGELHHAVAAGVIGPDDVHGSLGEVLAGRVPARTGPEEIFVFDSTGTALQDAAAAAAVYDRAVRSGIGTRLSLA